MALNIADRVKESSTSTGTGTLTLGGAVSGFQSFATIGNGNQCYYTIVHNSLDEWEVGVGTYTVSGTTLSRDTVLDSSSGGAKVSFSVGNKEVFVTYPADRSVSQYDIGTAPNEIPLNQYLGNLAYQDAENIAGDVGVGGDLDVGGTINDSIKIDASGNVGIGTSSPADLVQTSISANTAKGIRVTNTNLGTSTYASIYFGGATSETDSIIAGLGDSTTAYGGARSMVLGTNQATPVAFITQGTERARIDASGHLIVPAGITLGTAAGTYNAANTLDDYEEGTWTPSLGGDATYTAQAGTYTKVGRLVIANCILVVNTIGTGATNIVSGLPFTVRSQQQGFGGTLQYFENLANNVVMLNPSPNAGATTITFYTLAAAGGTTSYNTALWQNSTRIDFTVMYFT